MNEVMTAEEVAEKRFKPGCVWLSKKTWYFRAGKGDSIRLGFKTELPTQYHAWVRALPLLFEANGVPLPSATPSVYVSGSARVVLSDNQWVLRFAISGMEYESIIGNYPHIDVQLAHEKAEPLIRRLESGNWESLLQEPTANNWDRPDYTNAQYAAKLIEQDGKCAICKQEAKRLDYDHDHVTGELRDLLCGQCNRAIGLFKESPSRCIAAAEYLRRFGK